MKIYQIIFILFAFITGSYGQHFRYEAKVGPVKENGFYDILVTPEISTHLKADFADIRLFDTKKREVAYVKRKEVYKSSHVFKNYRIVENKVIPGCCNRLILQNPDKTNINNISIDIRNSAVEKSATLSGSDDCKNWYIIEDNFYLASLYNHKELSRFVLLDFPLSNYEFYKIEIQDTTNTPIQVLKAGYYDTYREEAKYLTLPLPTIKQRDSTDKKSYVTVTFPSPQLIDKITFDLDGPQPYFRHCSVNTLVKNKKRSYFNTVAESRIISGHEKTIALPAVFTDHLIISIENHDNSPLEFKSVIGHQLMNYLTANLHADETYTLRFGNDSLLTPEYDLEYFRDSLPAMKNIIKPESVKSVLAAKTEKKKNEESFFNSNWWIWAAIIIIGALLAYMSASMLKDMKEKKSE